MSHDFPEGPSRGDPEPQPTYAILPPVQAPSLWPLLFLVLRHRRRHQAFLVGGEGAGEAVHSPGPEVRLPPRPAFDQCVPAQTHPTLCDPLDCSPPGSSVHGTLQASTLEWAAMSFSKGSSQPRDQTHVSCFAGRLFTD